jgi:hypothetical protein
MTLRIKSNNCRLECEYSESEKPNATDVLYITSWHKFNNELFKITTDAWNNSFKPIQLSVSAEKYLLNEFGCYLYVITPKELSPTECEVFEVKNCAITGEPMLFLKEPVEPSTELIEQSQDELWEKVYLRMLTISQIENKDYIMDELKSKFTIKRKQ